MVILASKSPRRRELLGRLGIDFTVEVADTDEATTGENLFDVPQQNALRKARAVAAKHPLDTVIGADTAIIFEDRLIGKPENLAEAKKMLLAFSGKTHAVVTGIAVIGKDKERVWHEVSQVRFKALSEHDVENYLAAVPVLDKAGAYAIQSHGENIVESYTGEIENIIGLPLKKLGKILVG